MLTSYQFDKFYMLYLLLMPNTVWNFEWQGIRGGRDYAIVIESDEESNCFEVKSGNWQNYNKNLDFLLLMHIYVAFWWSLIAYVVFLARIFQNIVQMNFVRYYSPYSWLFFICSYFTILLATTTYMKKKRKKKNEIGDFQIY